MRAIASRNEITVDTLLGLKDRDNGKDNKEEPDTQVSIVTNVMSAVFNSDFITSVASLAVQNWDGIISNGKPMPCNDKNKQTVFSKFGNRALFIYRKCRNEKVFIGADLEGDLKNSEASLATS